MTRARFGRVSASVAGRGGTSAPTSFGTKGVGYVEDADPRVLVRREDQLRADKTPRPVFVNIVRTEMAAFGFVVGLGGCRER